MSSIWGLTERLYLLDSVASVYLKAFYFVLLPNFRKRITLLEDPKTSLSVTSSLEDGNGYGALEEWCWQEKTDVLGGEPFNTTLFTTNPSWKWYGLESGKPRLEVGDQPCGPWHGFWALKKQIFSQMLSSSSTVHLFVWWFPVFDPLFFWKAWYQNKNDYGAVLSDTDKGLFGLKPVALTLCLLKMSHGLARDGNWISTLKPEVKLINIYGFFSCLTMSTVSVLYFKTNRFRLLDK